MVHFPKGHCFPIHFLYKNSARVALGHRLQPFFVEKRCPFVMGHYFVLVPLGHQNSALLSKKALFSKMLSQGHCFSALFSLSVLWLWYHRINFKALC